MTGNDPQFDDPALRSAVKRAWAGESAPAGLRDRIHRALAAADGDAGQSVVDRPAVAGRIGPAKGAKAPRSVYRTAASIAILVLGGLALLYSIRTNVFPDRGDYAVDTFPRDLADAMVLAHTGVLTAKDLTLIAGVPDFRALSKELEGKVGVPVAAAPLEGWTLKGTRVTQLGDKPAAQLVFVKGDSTISLFSFASPYYAPPSGTTYQEIHKGAGIAGIVANHGIYCLVGTAADGPVDVDDLEEMRDDDVKKVIPLAFIDTCGTESASLGKF